MSFGNTKTPLKPKGKAKWQVPQRINKTNGLMEYYLTPELEVRFCKLFPKHSNRRIMAWFGLSFSTTQRFKKELGLEKDLKAIHKEQARDTKKICEKNGYYDSLRGKQPSEQCLAAYQAKLATGWTISGHIKENLPKVHKKRIRKMAEARSRLVAKEKRRYILGLEPISNLPINFYQDEQYTRQEVMVRNLAKRYGYIPGDKDPNKGERHTLFYTPETDRVLHRIFERNSITKGFSFLPIPKNLKVKVHYESFYQ